MKIFLDTSDPDLIRSAYKTGLIDGVTTNPSLMLAQGKEPKEVIKEIADIFEGQYASISAEVNSENVEDMLVEAEPFYHISQNITIKVPCNYDGLLACKNLSDLGVGVNVTLVFSISQAILAAKAGASFVSPFIGRVEDQRFDALGLIKGIVGTFETHAVHDTEVLAASTRSVEHIEKAFLYGADVVTMPPALFWKMYKHALTDAGLEKFKEDWKSLKEKL
ncbi:transaldolase [Cyanophage S-RIM14]|uniref:Transaldolase n=1 Tax=Cyanophage S-RIM14 TaxID=1278423 RepID=A0A1D7SKI1_9CAUD|nr:transaldolase [Cyanophage S-RIM14]